MTRTRDNGWGRRCPWRWWTILYRRRCSTAVPTATWRLVQWVGWGWRSRHGWIVRWRVTRVDLLCGFWVVVLHCFEIISEIKQTIDQHYIIGMDLVFNLTPPHKHSDQSTPSNNMQSFHPLKPSNIQFSSSTSCAAHFTLYSSRILGSINMPQRTAASPDDEDFVLPPKMRQIYFDSTSGVVERTYTQSLLRVECWCTLIARHFINKSISATGVSEKERCLVIDKDDALDGQS